MPREYPRSARLNAQLRLELSELLRGGMLHDPRLAEINLTVTAVDVASDLSHARVRVSSLDDEDAPLQQAVSALNHAAGKLRHELGARLHIRYVPQLAFEADMQMREADRINRLLRQALTEDASHAAARDRRRSSRVRKK